MAGSGKYCDCGRELDEHEYYFSCFECREEMLMDNLEAEAENEEPDRNEDGSLRELGT